MHPSALADARRFVERHLDGHHPLRIADVGSFDANGSLRPLFERPGWTYCGLDRLPGPNVDIVLPNDDSWPSLASGAFDVVVTSQVVDHIRRPWRWIQEIARICAPGGLIYVCAPNTWDYHERPIDCWRVWPEGLKALFEEAGIRPVEIYATGPDSTGIGVKKSEPEIQAESTAARLTLLCVTTGRPTLVQSLKAIQRQFLTDDDEVLLVHDGPVTAAVRELWSGAELPGRLIELQHGPHRDWGHTPRNLVLSEAAGDYVVHLDDDDACAPRAVELIRAAIRSAPGSLFLFRMDYPDGRTFWVDREVRIGNVGTGIFVHPTGIPLGRFGPTHEGDFEFVSETIKLNPGRQLQWREEVIALIRPQEAWCNPNFRDLTVLPGEAGRYDCQRGWHQFFGRYLRNRQILDIGAGMGLSRERLAAGGNTVELQDPAPDMPVDWHCDLTVLPTGHCEVVTAFDVIEHVPDVQSFLGHLARIARDVIVLTTPNSRVWHCGNDFHVREYTPPQLLHLVEVLERVQAIEFFTSSDADGSAPSPVSCEQFLVSKAPLLALLLRLKN